MLAAPGGTALESLVTSPTSNDSVATIGDGPALLEVPPLSGAASTAPRNISRHERPGVHHDWASISSSWTRTESAYFKGPENPYCGAPYASIVRSTRITESGGL